MKRIVLEIEVDLEVQEALAAIFRDASAQPGARMAVDADGSLIYLESVDEGLGFDETTLISLAVSFAVGVGSGVVANAIYNSVGKAIRKITVGGQRIRPSRQDLQNALDVLNEHIQQQSDDLSGE